MSPAVASRGSPLAYPALPFVALAALGTALPWWFPGTGFSAALAWLGAFALVPMLERARRPYLAAFAAGCFVTALGFYWLYGTIRHFGGFGPVPAALVFLFFVAGSAVQFLLFAFVFRNLPAALDRFALRGALGWVSSEFLAIRIFPWMIGHTQLGFPPLAQAADLSGAGLLSFVMVWCGEAAYRAATGSARRTHVLPFAALLGFSAYGAVRLADESLPGAHEIPVAVVQANVSIEEKHNVRFLKPNRERYAALTAGVAADGLLVIWPETALHEFIHARIRRAADDPRIPRWPQNVSLLVGALTAELDGRFYNSALAVLEGGEVLPPYHKRILMPFGEYTPFGEIFPFLAELNSTAGGFTAGDRSAVFAYPIGGRTVNVSPLICYEDILPRLSRDAVAAGAEVLVNLTNDAWFGDTIAPHQHHLIAAFRAIENRRWLIRSTNTGLTAVVDPLGRTTGSLPTYSEGVLRTGVRAGTAGTAFALWGELPWWAVSAGSVLAALALPRFRRRRGAVSSR